MEEVAMPEFWFNTRTGQVEEGRQSDWSQVLGPYPTPEAAARALDTARSRSEAWDREDREWAEGRPAHDEPDGDPSAPGAPGA
jgi:hypothetical protein